VAPSDQGSKQTLSPLHSSKSDFTLTTNSVPEPLSLVETNAHIPDPFPVREIRKRKARDKRIHNAAAKLRRSHCLAAKEETTFLDMLEKAIRKKAVHFDLSAATASLSAALNATGLADTPEVPAMDPGPLAAVALECGVSAAEAAELYEPEVPEKFPHECGPPHSRSGLPPATELRHAQHRPRQLRSNVAKPILPFISVSLHHCSRAGSSLSVSVSYFIVRVNRTVINE
jgi:hypothetical protein